MPEIPRLECSLVLHRWAKRGDAGPKKQRNQILEPETTVDGSEIRRSPVEVGSFIPLFTRF